MTASKYIPGLGKDFFIGSNHIGIKGGAEKYIPGLGKEFLIGADETSPQGGAEKYIPGLGREFFIKPEYIQAGTVTFSAGQAGVSIVFNSETKITGVDGTAVFHNVPCGEHEYVATLELHKPLSEWIFAIGNRTIAMSLETIGE